MTKLTTHAVVFLALTGFTVTAAIVFQNPPLVYTAVFMATSNVVLYSWAQLSVRGLRVKRIHGTTAVATRPCEIELELFNERTTARYGTLGFDLHANLAPGNDYTPVAFLVAKPGETVRARYTITPPRRGVLKLGPFYLYGGDPFGFYKCWRKLPVLSELTVLPCPVDFHFTRPASTSLLAQDEMETIASPGESTEFLGVREYLEGEPLKRVHWRTSARLGKLISRQFELNVAASISTLLLVDQAMLTGTASIGISVARQLWRNRNTTSDTRISASSSVFTTSSMEAVTNGVVSNGTSALTPGGKVFESSAILAWSASTVRSALAPGRR